MGTGPGNHDFKYHLLVKLAETLTCWSFIRHPYILIKDFPRNPQSAHHPHKSNDEHRQCNPGGGIHFAVLLGSDNSYTTPLRNPCFDLKSFVVAVYGWWSPMPWPKKNVQNTMTRPSIGRGMSASPSLTRTWLAVSRTLKST